MTEYMKKRKIRLEETRIKDSSLFGLVAGTVFMLAGFLRWIVSYNGISYFWAALGIIGLFIFIAGVLIPQCIIWFYDGIRFIGNKIGHVIFSILLFVVYVLLIIPIGLLIKKKENHYFYAMWEGEYKGEKKSCFIPWKETMKTEAKGVGGNALGLLQYLFLNGRAVFLPVVFVLLFLGFILFFVSSSVFAPFIYTLF